MRATHDIDINVYLGVEAAARALDCLGVLGVPEPSADQRAEIRRTGQTRLRWEGVPLDLFFWNLDFHASCLEHRRTVALLDHTIDVLGPEDLIVCKVAFACEKDARDIVEMLDAMGERLDLHYVVA